MKVGLFDHIEHGERPTAQLFDERLAFIRSVGNAATLLTEDQRKILTGAMQPATPAPSPSAAMSPMSDM